MKLALPELRKLLAAALLVVALQPIYLLVLIAVDYLAPPERRAHNLTSITQKTAGDWDTECVSLSIGLEPSASPLRNAVFAARPVSRTADLKTVCDSLHAAAVGNDQRIYWLPYARYWHGYRVILDPLTAIMPVGKARIVMLLALAGAIVWFAAEFRLIAGREAMIALILPTVIFTDIFRMWLITSHTLATVVIFSGAALMARATRRGANLMLLAAVLGSVFNFVDFLTNPPWQPMLLAFVVIAAGRNWREAITVLTAWAAGYSLTWASKWGIAVAFGASWSDILDVITFRLNGDYGQMVGHHMLAPSAKVLSFLFQYIAQDSWRMAAAILIPVILLQISKLQWRAFALLSWPAIIPFAWFEILSNHTQIHVWNAYRPVASSIGIAIAALSLASNNKQAVFKTATGRGSRSDNLAAKTGVGN